MDETKRICEKTNTEEVGYLFLDGIFKEFSKVARGSFWGVTNFRQELKTSTGGSPQFLYNFAV